MTARGRVLVVEDEPYVRDSLVAVLAARGFETASAASVTEALAWLAKTSVDVVLSDLRMPHVDGLVLVKRLQALSPEIPVVILTGHGHLSSATACLKAGARDYILKPAEPAMLEHRLARAMEPVPRDVRTE